MKITKNIKFEEIEKLFISCYNYTRFGDIKYPPNLKELYISLLCCEIEDLKKLNLPITLEKIYIALKYEQPELLMSDELIEQSKKPINKMLELSAKFGL